MAANFFQVLQIAIILGFLGHMGLMLQLLGSAITVQKEL